MAPLSSNHSPRQVCFLLLLLSTAALAVADPISYSSHCSSPAPAPDRRHAEVASDVELPTFNAFTGFFAGRGVDRLLSPDGVGLRGRSFSFLPDGVARTSDPTLLHLTATLTLLVETTGNASSCEHEGRPETYRRSHSISFNLDGYYSSTTSELCMVGRRELNGWTSTTDSQILMTVHFTSSGEPPLGFRHGKGRISSLRDSTDDLYFETRDITFFGSMDNQQTGRWIWRMELESIVRVASKILFCVFVVLQIQHAKRNHEAPAAATMSMTIVPVVLSLGCVVLDLILSHWVFFLVTFVYMFS